MACFLSKHLYISEVSQDLKVVSKPETELKKETGSMCDTTNVAEKSKENVIIAYLHFLNVYKNG